MNLKFTKPSRLSALNFCISLPISVFWIFVNKSSLSMALYSNYLVHVSHWPISIQNYKIFIFIWKLDQVFPSKYPCFQEPDLQGWYSEIIRLLYVMYFWICFWPTTKRESKRLYLKTKLRLIARSNHSSSWRKVFLNAEKGSRDCKMTLYLISSTFFRGLMFKAPLHSLL